MITDAPIRGLSNQVVLDTASTVKAFFELCQAAECGYVALPPEEQASVVAVDSLMSMVVKSQSALIQALENVDEDQIASPSFQKVIADLERVVSQGESAISDTYSAPAKIVELWQNNLNTMSEQNGHIDNYVESFRIAFDETCAALLADMASRVAADDAATAK